MNIADLRYNNSDKICRDHTYILGTTLSQEKSLGTTLSQEYQAEFLQLHQVPILGVFMEIGALLI